jgi:hypothetical protein
MLIGTVADSTTRHGIRGAVVRLKSRGPGPLDSLFAYTDSAGGFAFSRLKAGRYAYSVGSVNFGFRRDSIDVRSGIDTLAVMLRRGPGLCDVRLTMR